jgi:hypothetical protein
VSAADATGGRVLFSESIIVNGWPALISSPHQAKSLLKLTSDRHNADD